VKVEQVLKSREVELAVANAISLMTKNIKKPGPSHSVGHMYYTGKKAVEEAIKEGVTDRELLQDIFIAGMYHDITRSGLSVSGVKDAEKSARKTEEILKRILPGHRTDRIRRMIEGDKNAPGTKYLFMADYSELTPYRSYAFGYYEHPVAGRLTLMYKKVKEGKDTPEIYRDELARKEEELEELGVSRQRIEELRKQTKEESLRLEKTFRERWGDWSGRKMAGEAGAAIETKRVEKALEEMGRLFPGIKARFKEVFRTKGRNITSLKRRPVYRYEKGKLRRRRIRGR